MKILEEISDYRAEIKTDTYTTTWREILGQFKDGELRIDPDYQRLFRWDIGRQTQFIESLLLSIPSPPIFVYQDEDGIFEVIDGLQRVSTLIKFFSDEIFDGSEKVYLDNRFSENIKVSNENDISVPSVLCSAPLIKSLEGYSYKTLPETLIRTIKYSRVTVMMLEIDTPPRVRYEVFKRLNRQGAILSDQEIRNCTARIFGKKFADELRSIADYLPLINSLDFSEEDVMKMKVEETILRFLAFNFFNKDYSGSVKEYLDDFMVYASEGKFVLTEDVKSKIFRTAELINTTFPDGNAFRNVKGGFSSNLFDVFFSAVFHSIENVNSDLIYRKRMELLQSNDYANVSGTGTNAKKKVEGRIDLAKKLFL
ncbi:DUF262 domain-containing protein [Comamonas aquatica]|uniref:DUF262 domain-containing protein n=1 Tax=Comamonas aquatica TaxID=225991 RepID=UPI0024494805|nr:DUF262 domain-containing protein [Comamonas aquatica]MDH0494073.1 DUF262 domain-containing protein [Comamonas aquatica]MDH1674518.1 DUF262 domain-containing protein [Comamonas aquatica]MDH1678909.1 DUF262 domain-containing protein [Comamonas aquatica]